jgi:transcriptional regulator with XRE-family HTH domain
MRRAGRGRCGQQRSTGAGRDVVMGQAGRLGERLRRYREAAGYSQEELAERAGLTANAISALERGERKRPYPDTVRRLAAALGLSEDERLELVAAVARARGRAARSSAPEPGALPRATV